ncbi:FAD-dependent oxidoreductase [Patescibacteria group bacterium]|nr:FAD-dependent oxidoreductase [Patescibacteria group bacterium]
MTENVIIIGGGPAGLAAAIYNARAGLKPLVVAGSPPGGQLTLTTEVENYPGFESIMGPDLVLKMRKHAEKFGVRFVDENVISVDFDKKPFEIFLPAVGVGSSDPKKGEITSPLQSRSVLIATGAKALWLNLPSEQRLRGKGVSACATCDGFFFRNKVVGVVGGGDTAMEEALTLTKFVEKVYIIHRRPEFRASKIMQDRVLKHPKIHEIFNAEVDEVLGSQKVEGVKVKIRPSDKGLLKKTKEELEKISPEMLKMKVLDVNDEFMVGQFPLDGLFVAIGHKPDTAIFKDKIQLDRKEYIITAERLAFENDKLPMTNVKFPNREFRSATSVGGVFAAGDCVDHEYRQAATAVGMGVAAALDVEKFLTV